MIVVVFKPVESDEEWQPTPTTVDDLRTWLSKALELSGPDVEVWNIFEQEG